MNRIFNHLFGKPSRTARATRPVFESLEGRQLFSAVPQALAPVPLTLGTSDPIQVKYNQLGGAKTIGKPLSGETATWNGGKYEKFQKGTIFYSPGTGAHVLYLGTSAEYFSTSHEKDAYGINVQSILGLPTSDEQSLSGTAGAKVVNLQGGTIFWSLPTGAHVVFGGIGAEYATTAYEKDTGGINVQSILGLPTSDETNVPGVAGARMNTFQNGAIYYSPATGAHVLYGALFSKYKAIGGPTAVGLPSGDPTLTTSAYTAVVSLQNGLDLFYNPSAGAHLVYGAIGQEYANTATETDYYGQSVQQILGAPTSDEMNVPGVSGARMNTFQGGVIYYSGATGAHDVIGGILQLYKSMGGPTSYLGLPTSDEQAIPGGRVSDFQNGKILWTPTGGARAVQNAPELLFTTGNLSFDHVTGSATLALFPDGRYDFSGSFYDHGDLSRNYSVVLSVLTPGGVLYTFSHSGSMSGSWSFSGSQSDTFDTSGYSVDVANNWTDLQGSTTVSQASASIDYISLLKDLEEVVNDTASVIQIITVL